MTLFLPPSSHPLPLNWCIVDYIDGHQHVLHMSEGREVWRECMRWLVDVGALESNFADSASMTDFCATLRDGVILHNLSSNLLNGRIDHKKFVLKPSSQFSSKKNINSFLSICRDHFHIADRDLFTDNDLFHMENFLKVLNVLSMVSHSEQAYQKGIEPFPRRSDSSLSSDTPDLSSGSNSECCSMVNGSSPWRNIEATETEEEIYQALPKKVDDGDLDDVIYCPAGIYSNQVVASEEKVYDSIVKKPLSHSPSTVSDPNIARYLRYTPQTKREHVIKEILDTEQNYVEKGLNMISRRFHTPLESAMSEADHATVFMNISDLWLFHSTFYAELRAAAFNALGLTESDRPNTITIGKVFLNHKHKFTMYGAYCMGLDESRAKIIELEKSDSIVRQRIQECCNSIEQQQFKLQDLLCLPMQRVLKYHLLLRELVKYTEVGHPEFQELDKAKEAMEDVNMYVNELKRDMETKATVDDIERSITDLQMPENYTLIDYGREHKDGEVKLAELTQSNSSAKLKARYCFLFDKVLIICKANRNNTYTYKSAYIVGELHIDDHALTSNGTLNSIGGTISRKLTGQHTLTLVNTIARERARESNARMDSETVKFIQMSFKSEAQRRQWADAFQTAAGNVRPNAGKSGHSPHYETFTETLGEDWPPCCGVCSNYLKGMFYQGYKCEKCKRGFHRECLSVGACGVNNNHRLSMQLSSLTRLTPSTSFNNGSTMPSTSRLPKTVVHPGEQVAARFRYYPSDDQLLCFDKDDILEVLSVLPDGRIIACHNSNRSKQGIVSVEHVRKVRLPTSLSLDSPVTRPPLNVSAIVTRKESTLLPRPAVPSILSPMSPAMEYVNTDVNGQEWYKGELTREESELRLLGTENGTFLVRFSPKRREYVISISYGGDVKHTIVEEDRAMGIFYLDKESTKFPSIVELVNYYRDHNLRESFTALDTKLTKPWRDCKVFKAIHDFPATEAKFLNLKVGDRVNLVDTMGEERGWWKGRVGEKVGFFPLNYVEPMTEEDAALTAR